MITIKQDLVPNNKHNIKCPYSMSPIGICVHNTANDAPAKNEITYMKNNNNEVSFHVAVDDVEAIQGILFNRNAWAAGDGGSGQGNRKYIHIEICYSKSGGDKFVRSEKNAAKVVAKLLKQYNWGVDKVKKHQDFSGKYCPHRTLDMGWSRFINMIKNELNPTASPQPSKPSTNSELYRVRKTWSDSASQKGAYSDKNNAITECKKQKGYKVYDSSGKEVYSNAVSQPSNPSAPQNGDKEIKRYTEHGTCKVTTDVLNVRNKPSTSGEIVAKYYKNETVRYDMVVLTEKYVWISWVGASSRTRRYMAVKDKKANTRWGNCY